MTQTALEVKEHRLHCTIKHKQSNLYKKHRAASSIVQTVDINFEAQQRNYALFRVWDIAQCAMIYFSFGDIAKAEYLERRGYSYVWGYAKSKEHPTNPHLYPLPVSTKITSTENPIMFYSGVVDKRGNRIFSGDIVSFSWFIGEHDVENSTGEVYFEEGLFLFGRKDQFATNDSNFDKKSLEIIGNIYENSTLLT